MGVLNVTPDSFSDGGRFYGREDALRHAEEMADTGADIIDVGGESTRPGAQNVDVQQELDRVVPVIAALRENLDIPVSVDTSKPEVMRAAVAAGAGFINDVYALRREGALEAAVNAGVPVCLMHMQGEPRTMQRNPHYIDVVAEIKQFLSARLTACVQAGIPRDRLLVDPGFGFGKTAAHNLTLLRNLNELTTLEVPVVVGLSRKRLIGDLLGLAVEERVAASVALAVKAAANGASVVRVHDVKMTRDAIRMMEIVDQRE